MRQQARGTVQGDRRRKGPARSQGRGRAQRGRRGGGRGWAEQLPPARLGGDAGPKPLELGRGGPRPGVALRGEAAPAGGGALLRAHRVAQRHGTGAGGFLPRAGSLDGPRRGERDERRGPAGPRQLPWQPFDLLPGAGRRCRDPGQAVPRQRLSDAPGAPGAPHDVPAEPAAGRGDGHHAAAPVPGPVGAGGHPGRPLGHRHGAGAPRQHPGGGGEPPPPSARGVRCEQCGRGRRQPEGVRGQGPRRVLLHQAPPGPECRARQQRRRGR
mmetsp:Transcript_40650/g.96593  ORF Transcript_40650/g.96593 Transcript_40650/m.96593 type:complete len:269 (+) Transcript_40650:1891-2697(+)